MLGVIKPANFFEIRVVTFHAHTANYFVVLIFSLNEKITTFNFIHIFVLQLIEKENKKSLSN
jgi:hypothetical protein